MERLSDILELMYRDDEDYRTLRATIRTWSHRDRVDRAFDRWQETSEGTSQRITLDTGDGGEDPPIESETIERHWLERGPGGFRSELEGQHIRVSDGRTLRSYSPGWGTTIHKLGPPEGDGAGHKAA